MKGKNLVLSSVDSSIGYCQSLGLGLVEQMAGDQTRIKHMEYFRTWHGSVLVYISYLL